MSKPIPFIEKFTPPSELGAFAFARQANGFYLGEFHPDHGVTGEAGIEDDRHVFIVAGNRAGKGTTLLIPNLLRWTPDANGKGGGIFCIDPKGENAAITACARGDHATAKEWGSSVTHCIGQPVAILDPLGVVKGPARAYVVDYNPFVDVDIADDDGAAGEMETFCEAVVLQEDGAGAHWSESASTILAGAIEWALHTQPRSRVTWTFVRKAIFDGLRMKAKGNGEMHPFAAELQRVETPEGLAQMAASIIDAAGENERGSFVTTLMRQMKWLNHRKMTDHLQGKGGFSLKRAVLENWAVYVCIPPGMINRFRRWLRLMVAIALDAKTQSPFDHEGPQTLFVLDEFAALGAFAQIESGASNLAGYGVKLVTVIQNIGQLQKTYEKNWETFLGNAGVIVAWGLNDKESEDYISHRIGQMMATVEGVSMSMNARMPRSGEMVVGGSEGATRSVSTQQLPIIWPNEVREFGGRQEMRAFVITAEGQTFTTRRVSYHNEQSTGFYDDPAFIKAWEAQRQTHRA
ncbi:MAG: type IV secretory system conjugative DNA transfer family protein [Pseudomonadota bacterium]